MTDAQCIYLIITISPRVRPGSVDSFRQWKACRMRGQSVWTAEIIVSSWCLSKALNRSVDYINYSASCTLMGFCEWKIHRLWSRHFILTLDLILSEKRARTEGRQKLKVRMRVDDEVLNYSIDKTGVKQITWKKRMMFQMSPRIMEEFPSATSAASILTSFTWGHTFVC